MIIPAVINIRPWSSDYSGMKANDTLFFFRTISYHILRSYQQGMYFGKKKVHS